MQALHAAAFLILEGKEPWPGEFIRIVSKVDIQEVRNAIDQALKEIPPAL